MLLKPNNGKQEFALRQPYSIFEILYGGARGGGKTFAGLMWLVEPQYVNNPNYAALVIRRNSNDLSDWLDRARTMYSSLGGVVTNNSLIRFPSGAKIRLGHLKDDSTYTKYQGHEYQKMLIEELTQIPTLERYLRLISSCRTTHQELPAQVFSTANPGGVGHLWVKERFIDPSEPNRPFIGEDDLRRVYIPATIDDNPVLKEADPNYVKRIESLKYSDEALYKAWRFGDWNIFVGQVFKEWRQAKHVIDNLPVPLQEFATWEKYCALDWGYNDPCSVHWIAISPENEFGVKRYYVYREIYVRETRPREVATDLANYFKDEPVEMLIMPHDTYSNLGGNKPIVDQFAEVFEELNIDVELVNGEAKSHRSKINRQALLHEVLAEAIDGVAYLQVLKNCRNLIRTLPSLPYSDSHPEELDDKSEDHAYDSLTYGLYKIIDNIDGRLISQVGQPIIKPQQGFTSHNDMSNEPLIDIGQILNNKNNRDWRSL